MSTPLFSVVLPTYERPEMIERSVSSVLSQSFPDFELIVVDDGSSAPYSAALSGRDPRVRVIRGDVNRGVAAARNAGVAAARGKYISFLDDDDEYLSSFLESTHARLRDAPPEVGLSWCSVKCIEYPEIPGGEARVWMREFRTEYPSRRELFEELMSIGTGFGVTVEAACLRRIDAFKGDLETVEDTDMFFRVLANGFVPVVVPGVHVVLHNHRQPRLTGVAKHSVRIRECEILIERYSKFFEEYPTLRAQLLRQIDYLRGQLGGARER